MFIGRDAVRFKEGVFFVKKFLSKPFAFFLAIAMCFSVTMVPSAFAAETGTVSATADAESAQVPTEEALISTAEETGTAGSYPPVGPFNASNNTGSGSVNLGGGTYTVVVYNPHGTSNTEVIFAFNLYTD